MIEIDNLCKHLDGQDVLCEVSFTIEEGETFAIIGHSGSGKTVLLKHLVGLMTPDAGRVVIDGVDMASLSQRDLREVRRKFGMLFQNGALFDSMSVYENTAFPLRMFTKMDEPEIARRVQECLEMVELPGALAKQPAQLSGGQRKRVALARAIVLEPDYLFYDEPNSGLDPETSNTIDELISTLADELNVTSIVVTHDMHSVLTIADRVGFVHDGTMQFVGTVEEMRACPDPELCEFVQADAYQL